MTSTRIPLIPGRWLPLTESEAQAFVERLTAALTVSQGSAAFTKNLPISGLRAVPLSFYPGWLVVEGEAQLTPDEFGTFDVLYGPGFMWVIDGTSNVINDLNTGRISDGTLKLDGKAANGESAVPPSFLPNPLVKLDASVTGPDYLRFFCGSVWGDAGPFWLVENPDAAILQGARFPDNNWRAHIKPIAMKPVDDYLIGEAVLAYMGSLFWVRLRVQNGIVVMVDDEPLTADVVPTQQYRSPFRNLRPGTMKLTDTSGNR